MTSKSSMHRSLENHIHLACPSPAAIGPPKLMVAIVANTETSADRDMPYGQSGIGFPLKATRTPTMAAIAANAKNQANHSSSHRSTTARRNRLRCRSIVLGLRCVLVVSNCEIGLLDRFSRLLMGSYEVLLRDRSRPRKGFDMIAASSVKR